MNKLDLYGLLKFKNDDINIFDDKILCDLNFSYDIKEYCQMVWENIKTLYQVCLNTDNENEIKYISSHILLLLRSYTYKIGSFDIETLAFENALEVVSASHFVYLLHAHLSSSLDDSKLNDKNALLVEIYDYVKNILDIKEDD